MKIPHHPFFLFGMGNRRKFLYKAGTLYDALTGETVIKGLWDGHAWVNEAREGQAVALVPVGAPESLAEAVKSLLADPQRCMDLGARSARLYRETFCLSRTIATLRTGTEVTEETSK